MNDVTVEIDWIGRRVADLPRRTRGRMGRRRRDDDRGSGWLDALDLPFEVADSLVLAAVIALLLVLSFLFWQGFVGAILLFLLEVVVLVPVAVAVLVWRTLLGHPWRVIVRSGDEPVRDWDTRTWFAARRLVRALRSQLAAGATPDQLHAPITP